MTYNKIHIVSIYSKKNGYELPLLAVKFTAEANFFEEQLSDLFCFMAVDNEWEVKLTTVPIIKIDAAN